MKQISRRPNGSKKVVSLPEGDSLTQLNIQKQTDVNYIIAKYKRTGSIDHLRNVQQGVYADLADLPDYQAALNTVIQANVSFETIPAHLRQRFNNSPKEFLEYLKNPANNNEAIQLGLKKAPVPPPPTVVPNDPAVKP